MGKHERWAEHVAFAPLVAHWRRMLFGRTTINDTRLLTPPAPSMRRRKSRYRLGPDNRYVLDGDGRPIPRSFA